MDLNQKIETLLDKEEIKEVVSRWAFWRDNNDFQKLKTCFWDSANISVSFHSGTIEDFIKKISNMGNTIHFVGSINVEVNRNRAQAVSNTIVMARGKKEPEVDITSYLRFYDHFEKRNGEWRILERTAVYEKDRFDAVDTHKYDPKGITKKFPESCKHLCLALSSLNLDLPLDKIIERKTNNENILIENGKKWLMEN